MNTHNSSLTARWAQGTLAAAIVLLFLCAGFPTHAPAKDSSPRDTATWQRKFTELARRYEKEPEGRTEIVRKLKKIVKKNMRPSRQSRVASEDCFAFYDRYTKLFAKEKALPRLLHRHQDQYFEWAFAHADGPASLRHLRNWCKLRGFEAGQRKVERVLSKLQQPATGARGAERRRERARDRLAKAQAAVAEFKENVTQDVGALFEETIACVSPRRRRGLSSKAS